MRRCRGVARRGNARFAGLIRSPREQQVSATACRAPDINMNVDAAGVGLRARPATNPVLLTTSADTFKGSCNRSIHRWRVVVDGPVRQSGIDGKNSQTFGVVDVT